MIPFIEGEKNGIKFRAINEDIEYGCVHAMLRGETEDKMITSELGVLIIE